MYEQTIHLHREAPFKPAEGQACNGCGVCCALETCPAGRLRFLQSKGPCPALEWADGEVRYRCGLLVDPGKYLGWIPNRAEGFIQRQLVRWIAAGAGCDCNAEVQT